MKLTAGDLRKIAHNELNMPESGKRWTAAGVSTDTRTVAPGMIFVALRGEKFDGHDFLEEAVRRGAAGLVVDTRGADRAPSNVATLVVEDTTRALGTLARNYREKFDIPVIAVGGSNGKTTTKDMMARVLGQRYAVHATQGNLNNQIGVPLTLLGLNRSHEIAVIELGTNHPGELEPLCRIVRPTHVLLTNIGHEHLEYFGSLAGVADEETMLWRWAVQEKQPVVFVNADDALVSKAAGDVKRAVRFGFTKQRINVRGSALSVNEQGCSRFRFNGSRMKRPVSVQLSVPGLHNAHNALAAAAVGLTLRVSPQAIAAALQEFRASSKRMEALQIGGVQILNDTYNANGDSAIAGLQTLAATVATGKRIAVFGDMLELGEHSAAEHERVGAMAAELGIDYVLTFGKWAEHISRAARECHTVHYVQKNILAEYLVELVSPGDVVLIKGSRGMAMEDVLVFLQQRLGAPVPAV